jgi:hypothetical protein
MEGREALPISLLDRLPYLHRFLLEVGRLYPSLLNLPRVVVEEFQIDGYRIVPGTRVALAVAGTNLLARLHRDPLRFDLERFADVDNNPAARPFQLLTFAGGSRICMGMRFAQLEFKAIFARVAAQLELAPAVELPVPHAGFWAARPAGPLRVRVRRRLNGVGHRRASRTSRSDAEIPAAEQLEATLGKGRDGVRRRPAVPGTARSAPPRFLRRCRRAGRHRCRRSFRPP